MDTRKNERTETTHEVILRMSDAVEDAPYALESAKVVDAKPASSKEDYFVTTGVATICCHPVPFLATDREPEGQG